MKFASEINATITKAERQPKAVPTAVPRGTPMMLATLMPPTTIASAMPRLPGGMIEVAIRMARPK